MIFTTFSRGVGGGGGKAAIYQEKSIITMLIYDYSRHVTRPNICFADSLQLLWDIETLRRIQENCAKLHRPERWVVYAFQIRSDFWCTEIYQLFHSSEWVA